VKAAKEFPPSLKKGPIEVEEERRNYKETGQVGIDVPNRLIARGSAIHLAELIPLVRLPGSGRSGVTGGLSARGLANVAVGDWSGDFMVIVGDHRYLRPSSRIVCLSDVARD
jgi:hypothetical protein